MAKSKNKFSLSNFLNFLNQHFTLIIITLIVLIIGFLGGSLWTENRIYKSNNILKVNDQVTDTENPNDSLVESFILDNVPEFNETDHFLGKKDADITMISYSDFQCSYSQLWHSTFNSLVEKYGEQITFVYRHFSLGFSYSDKLAQASECVAKYGGEDAFWKFNNSIYEKLLDKSIYTLENNNQVISDDTIFTIAANAGVSPNQVQDCVLKQETEGSIQEIMLGATSAGINGTPATVIISDKAGRDLIPGALPLEEVETYLEKHL